MDYPDVMAKELAKQNTAWWRAKMWRWRHNALLGTIGIIRAHVKVLKQAKSIEWWGRECIGHIEYYLNELDTSVRNLRVEEDGTRVAVKHHGK